jgi:hypothetical protein
MADFPSALRTRLVEDTAVAAVVGAKVYWSIVPQAAVLPYIRLQTVSDERPIDMKGYQARREPRVQADCFAATYGAARGLADKVVAALATPETVGGVVFGFVRASGPRDLGEDTSAGFVHRASLDLIVEHRLA